MAFNETGIFNEGVTEADVAEYLAKEEEFREIEARLSQPGDTSLNTLALDIESLSGRADLEARRDAMAIELTATRARLVRGCGKGPIPSDLHIGTDKHGNAILICEHRPVQHRYAMNGDELM